ncbi:PREDICTED: thymidylate kinase-like isoform X2 [Nicotiana attenuata]|uniref:thymidylate kinase-like isoform X2 n=1 Tax=Nicotiana attenuata TaxID=49451 RepID=UPI0009056DF5|nr:PREDICTED: thymidylate kinase-like isoform X2 [Nicotiana attenuata]
MRYDCTFTISKALKFGVVVAQGSLKFSLNLKLPFKPSRNIHMENKENSSSRGALIVLEGLDRCGKTSQSSRLYKYLDEQGYSVESWRFPDRNTGVGQMISSYLANQAHLDDHAIHLLFSANRWEKRMLMEEKLRSGTTLIVDRYSYSGVAFSSAKGLHTEWCKKAAERGGYGGERYEQLEFQKKVAKSYLTLHDSSWKVIDATLPVEDIEEKLREIVLDSMTICQKGKPLSQLWSS